MLKMLAMEPQEGKMAVLYESDLTDPEAARDELTGVDAKKAAIQFAASQGYPGATLTQHPPRVFPVDQDGKTHEIAVPANSVIHWRALLPLFTGM